MQECLKYLLCVLCVSVVNIFWGGCAKQGAPPGGPEDVTGPLVRSSFPQPDDVRVPVNIRPWIELNEYPQRGSVAGAVFISPALETVGLAPPFEARVKGKRLEVRFANPLPENRTVAITFGTGVKDLVGNSMLEPFVLAFSTGDSLDQAAIEGDITGMEKPEDVWVWAYPSDTLANPDPAKNPAPFATQPDDQGHFRLAYLPADSFRIFAVAETRLDRRWQSQTEALAVPPGDVMASVENPSSLNLRLILRDLMPPRLTGAEALDRQVFRLTFDEPVMGAETRAAATSKDGQALSIIYAYQNPADSTALLLTTAIQREGEEYQVRVDSLPDRSGNVADSLVVRIKAATQADTIGPRFTWSRPVNGNEEADLVASLRVGFSEAVTLTEVPHAVRLTDSAGVEIGGVWSYPFPAVGDYLPKSPLNPSALYKISIYGDSLRDIFSIVSPDSFASVVFRTQDPAQLGSITGQVEGAVVNLRVVADRLDQAVQASLPVSVSQEASVGADGQYRLENLPAAEYRLWLYQDIDRNQRWSPGRIEPFIFAEPFAPARDSVRVRAGWETEGVNLTW